ncbi:hypothetical protein F5Y10DRAFT_228944, partial [Nemania abortiva]
MMHGVFWCSVQVLSVLYVHYHAWRASGCPTWITVHVRLLLDPDRLLLQHTIPHCRLRMCGTEFFSRSNRGTNHSLIFSQVDGVL